MQLPNEQLESFKLTSLAIPGCIDRPGTEEGVVEVGCGVTEGGYEELFEELGSSGDHVDQKAISTKGCMSHFEASWDG